MMETSYFACLLSLSTAYWTDQLQPKLLNDCWIFYSDNALPLCMFREPVNTLQLQEHSSAPRIVPLPIHNFELCAKVMCL